MSGYARKYEAIGLLNTEWGDFGHINNPSFSTPGIVYGGVFTWNLDAYSGENCIEKEELNKALSYLEYGDKTETFVKLFEKAALNQIYDWWTAVLLFEGFDKEERFDENTDPSGFNSHMVLKERLEKFREDIDSVDRASVELYEIRKQFRKAVISMDSLDKEEFTKVDNAIVGIDILNRMGKAVVIPDSMDKKDKCLLAEELEVWFMRYKGIYRSDSKESMLNRVEKVVFWYADKLRGL